MSPFKAISFLSLHASFPSLFDLVEKKTVITNTVIDRRDHLGGNAWSSVDAETGIEVHRYGSHIFHTSNERVWEYVRRFTAFTGYRHRVYSTHAGTVYPLPINLGTLNQFYMRSRFIWF
jgi:UDP-galactopyranose mutase